SYLPNLFKPNPEVISFDDIFSLIKSDEHLETLTIAYRTNPFANEVDRKQLKQQFPCFFPTVNLGQNDVNKLTLQSTPTGIVQFDVDIKDNPDVNVGTLISKLTTYVPELAYYFISPSGGLKFGLRTDFSKSQEVLQDEAQPLKDTKERFRTAYQIAKAYVLSVVPGVVFDDSAETLKLGCFLSHDPEAYLNLACNPYLLNDQCFSSHSPRERLQTYGTIDVEKVKTLLSFIPRHFNYHQRLPINAAVLNSIGEVGIEILFNHWTTDSRDKLKADLLYQFKHPLHHNLGYLFNQARQYGYRAATTGRARKKLAVRYLTGDTPKTHNAISTETLKKLFTIAQANNAVSSAVERFFRDRKDILINSSIGIGKSEEVLKVLKQTPWKVKALYINNNHALLAELKQRFDALEFERKPGATHSTVQHIQGKTRLCEYEAVKQAYQDIPIPRQQCEQDCPYFAECVYTTQFQSFANIRLIAANDLFNEKASYDSNWKPDVIIIDENFLKLETYTETLETDWQSIR
ncbi:MAG: BT4734/BF3469 family protein, partial [Caldilineaceae bacterium]